MHGNGLIHDWSEVQYLIIGFKVCGARCTGFKIRFQGLWCRIKDAGFEA